MARKPYSIRHVCEQCGIERRVTRIPKTGLCLACTQSQPHIQGRQEGEVHDYPTFSLPGTDHKRATLAERCAVGLPLFRADDAKQDLR